MADTLDTVARYLAQIEAEKRRKKAEEDPGLDRSVAVRRGTGRVDLMRAVDNLGEKGITEDTGLTVDPSKIKGHEWVNTRDYGELRERVAPVKAPEGKLPFISGLRVHPTPAGYGEPDPDMSAAMSAAATDARPLAGKRPAMPPPPVAPEEAGAAPASAAPAGAARARREQVLQLGSTRSGTAAPPVRGFRPLAGLAPGASADRWTGLPEGVASFMRERSGLETAQEDANRRGLGVELASAFSQMAAGVAGGQYNDEAWNPQREAARQPVADYQAQADEERTQADSERRAAADARAADEAAREAEMALRRFEFDRDRGAASDQLARDRMAQERDLAEARMGSEEQDRALRREEIRLRRTEGASLKERLAEEREEERKRREGERDLQRVGEQTAKAPFGEFQAALEEIDRITPGLAFGVVPENSPISGGDRLAQALLPRGAADWVMSEQGKRYSTAAANLRDLVSRMRSGAVLNVGEERHYLNLLSDDKVSDPRTAAYGINAVRTGIANKLRNVQAAYADTGVLDRYEKTGATSYRAPIFSAQGALKRQYSPSRNQTRVIDTSTGQVLRVEEGDTRGR